MIPKPFHVGAMRAALIVACLALLASDPMPSRAEEPAARVYLPFAAHSAGWPDAALADSLWAAVERFVAVHPEATSEQAGASARRGTAPSASAILRRLAHPPLTARRPQ